MSIPKEPRQIMINLMYLVLTAMLALNVSSEILHAFKVINASILSSNTNIKGKTDQIYASLEKQANDPTSAARVKPYNDKAKQVRIAADSMMSYLENWKERVIDRSGGYEVDNGVKDIKAQSDIDAATKLLVEDKGGDTLKAKIQTLREMMLSNINPTDTGAIARQLPLAIAKLDKTDGNPTGDWSIGHFHMIPVMAAVTILSKFQNDVRNSEAIILNQINKDAGDIQVKFDDLDAIAVPTQSYVLAGQKVEARIMMVAYNKSVKPDVTHNTGTLTKTENGIAYWETTASGVGLQTVSGNVSIDLGGGRKEQKPYKFEYMVGSEGGSMQLDKMNVFYIGVDNPITVSAAGYSLEDVSVSFPDGEVKPSPDGKGHFLVRATKPFPNGTDVAIMAKTATGIKRVGGQKVRVLRIPNPVAEVAGKSGGYVPAAQFRPQLGVNAALHDFVFDARYIVTEFTYSVIKKRSPDLIGPFRVIGPIWNGNKDIMKIQSELRPGDRVFIDDIKAKGPDGQTRNLNPLSFTLT